MTHATRRRPGDAGRSMAPAVLALAALCMLAGDLHAQPAEPEEQAEPVSPTLLVRAFGSVQWTGTDRDDSPNSFTLGQFDLFVTSTLTDRLSVLAEVVFEASVDTRVVTDLERLQLTYRFDDHLQVTAGRYHTGIGFYNAAFHHGGFFETPIARPRAFAFEDEGGILPVHDVGVSVRGAVPKTGSRVHYLVEVGNGRTWLHDSPDESEDSNGAKAVNAGLAFHPPQLEGLEAGGSLYRDTIRIPGSGPAAHWIGTVYATYRTPPLELMAEWLQLHHRLPGGPQFVTHAGYAQLARAWGRWKPYYRFDRIDVDPATPLIGPIGSYTGHTVGLRVDPSEWVGLKVQYERVNDARQRGIDVVRAAAVFVF